MHFNLVASVPRLLVFVQVGVKVSNESLLSRALQNIYLAESIEALPERVACETVRERLLLR